MESMNLEAIFRAVMAEDSSALLALFEGGCAHLTMPSFGTISCNRIFVMLVKKLANRFRYLHVACKHIHATQEGRLALIEGELSYLFYDEERKADLPYVTPTALLCHLGDSGLIAWMNVYTGFDAFVGKQILRPAMYNAEEGLAASLPAAVRAYYEGLKADRRYELCRRHNAGDVIAIEENALFTQGDICTPQAHMTVFEMAGENVKAVRPYGEIVWDFKLWPTLY